MRKLGLLAALGYIGTIFGANYFIGHVGTPPKFPGAPHVFNVGFGLTAPSGVYFVAGALLLRNIVQKQLGRATAVVLGKTWGVLAAALAIASIELASNITVARRQVEFA